MTNVVTREDWLKDRVELLELEKAFDRKRDELSARRRQMPWVLVDEDYEFEGAEGPVRLGELFDGNTQLIVYHFMYGDDWEEGCPSCSFWADNFNGIGAHLNARDAGFAVISNAAYEKLAAYQKRMGWNFTWVSSLDNSFNFDFDVSFKEGQREAGNATYNYKKSTFPSNEAPGISVFSKDEDGKIYHTYSTYARGLDMMNGAYHYMDLLPKGRDEAELSHPMAWVKRHDVY